MEVQHNYKPTGDFLKLHLLPHVTKIFACNTGIPVVLCTKDGNVASRRTSYFGWKLWFPVVRWYLGWQRWLPVVLCTSDRNCDFPSYVGTSDDKCGFPSYFVLRMKIVISRRTLYFGLKVWFPLVLCITDEKCAFSLWYYTLNTNVASRRTSVLHMTNLLFDMLLHHGWKFDFPFGP